MRRWLQIRTVGFLRRGGPRLRSARKSLRYPLKVTAAVRLWSGMLSTNIDPNRLGLMIAIESRLGDLVWFEIGGLTKINQNQLF